MTGFTRESGIRVGRATLWVERNREVPEGFGKRGATSFPYQVCPAKLEGNLVGGSYAMASLYRWNGTTFVDRGTEDVTVYPWPGFEAEEDVIPNGTQVLLAFVGCWVAVPVGPRLVELCLAVDHPGRGIVFSAYLGVWNPTSHTWEYETGTGGTCQGAGSVNAIDWRYGVPYPTTGAKGLFIPRSSTDYGVIYECVSMDCESPGVDCCEYGTGK